MTHILLKIILLEFFLVDTGFGTCLKSTEKNIGNILAPIAMGGLAGMMYDNQAYGGQMPHIAVKIMPSKKLRLTPTEMNTLLFSIKREIHNKVNKLEGNKHKLNKINTTEELYEHRNDKEKHLSTWALNQAPVYMPFHETMKKKTANYQKTLGLAIKNLKNKFEENKGEGSEAKKEGSGTEVNKKLGS